MTHPLTWQAPQPLWGRFDGAAPANSGNDGRDGTVVGAGSVGANDANGGNAASSNASARGADQYAPALLRFASDDFMDQMLATLARAPAEIGALLARPETWRKPADDGRDLIEHTPLPRVAREAARRGAQRQPRAGLAATRAAATLNEQGRSREVPLKLYQPAHQRHYLVAASLVCRMPGLPERSVDAGGAEQVNFVVRRLLPAQAGANGTGSGGALCEFAWVKDAQEARWVRVNEAGADAAISVPGEELLPAFALPFHDDGDRPRTLWTGSVPVGRREAYMGGAVERKLAARLAQGQREAVLLPRQASAGQGVANAATMANGANAATTNNATNVTNATNSTNAPAPATAAGAATRKLARVTQFQLEVAEPWKTLIRSSYTATAVPGAADSAAFGTEPAAALAPRAFEFNLRQQMTSWLILLDLADYLAAYFEDLWAVVLANGSGLNALSPRRQALYGWLDSAAMPAVLETALLRPAGNSQLKPPSPSLRAALLAVHGAGVREGLERGERVYADSNHADATWPDFHFVLAGLDRSGAPCGPYATLNSLAPASAQEVEADPLVTPAQAGQAAAALLDRLTALVGRALDEGSDEREAPPIPFALQLKNALTANNGDAGWFVIRFVYTRRDCGPLHPPVVSAPTQRFQLANFFDSDAPARPIRVTLPLDTSPAGLRKFNKNTAFVVSDMLCGQIQRAKALGLGDLVRSVLPWPLHKDLDVGGGSCESGGGINIGMICSLSIPIITICALILLIIIVTLLDLIFRWLPYFVICFPVPGLKGKKGGA